MAIAVASPVQATVSTFNVPDQNVAETESYGTDFGAYVTADTDPATWLFVKNSGPAWFQVDANGTVSIAPPCGSSGDYPAQVTVSDGGGPQASNIFTIHVGVLRPLIDPYTEPTVAEGATDSLTFTVLDDGCHTPIWLPAQPGDLPDFATFDAFTGTLTVTPGLDDAGDYPATVRVTYPGSATTVENFQIHVTNTDQPPVLDPIADPTVAEGATLDVDISASDPDGDSMTIFTGPLPAFALLTDHLDGTATLHLAPGFTDEGDYPLLVAVLANGKTDTQTITIHVTHTDQPPVLDPIADQTVAEGATLNVPVSATDADGDTITLDYFGIVDPSLHATLTDNGNGTGTLHFAPDFTAASGSPYTITVDASTHANTGNDQTSFQLTVSNASPSDPVLTVPSDITVEATSAAGAVVDFVVTATDAEDGDVTASVLCTPASGSTFPLGATQVDCTAIDSENNIGVGHFNITVEDTTGPTIGAQGGGALPDITVTATSKNGAVVSFSAVATDAVDGNVTVTCTPPSGSLFPVGQTVVTCTATDANQNTSRATFTVTVGARPTVSVPPTDTRIGSSTPSGPTPAGLAWAGLLLLATAGFALGFTRRRTNR